MTSLARVTCRPVSMLTSRPMGTMNISLPDSLKAFVDEQVEKRGYRTSSEYVLELIRKEQDAEHMRVLLTKGGRFPAVGLMNKEWFDSLRPRARGAVA
jgi:antitoxin ParD1/3/4